MTRRFVSLAVWLGLGIALAGCSTPSPTVTSIAVTGTAPVVGATSQLTAIATFSDGSTQDITASGSSSVSTTAWSSSNTTVATVTATGVVTGVADGAVIITVTFLGVSGTETLTITG